MALQTSGKISLLDIRQEFGSQVGGSSLTDYYRGGAYVPDTSTNSGIPTSGSIKLSDFYGGSNYVPPSTTYYQFTPIYSTDSRNICTAINTTTVYQASTSPYINFNDPIYTTSSGTTTAAAGYYNNNDSSQPAYDYWDGSSWAGNPAFCFVGI